MSNKKYVLISNFELVTTVLVRGVPRIVNFKNGSRVAGTRGFFTTASEELQKALEKSGGFGRVFQLESSVDSLEEQKPAGTSADDGLTHDKTVTSKNKAIAYLQGNFGVAFSSTDSIEGMKQEAREKYGVVFDKWD